MKPIPFHDFAARWSEHRESVLEAVDRVGASGQWILGSEVQGFEAALAPLFAQRHAVGCASGLDALEIALRAAGLRQGERVLTTPLSAFATSLAIVRAGGIPVFCDVDESGQLDLERAREVLGADPGLRFVVPVHLFGHCVDLRRLATLRDEFELTIVEDCAQSIGASRDGLKAGSVGAFAATSFYPTKNLGAMGDAGALLTSDEEAADRARRLRNYGQREKAHHSELGLNSRLDEVQAAILRHAFLPQLAAASERRRAIAARYREELDHPALAVPPVPPGCEPAWHLFPVLVTEGRDAFRAHLERRGIGSELHYPVLIPEQAALREVDGARALGELARAAAFAASEVSLPLHPYLDDEDVTRVVEACNGWAR